MTAGWWPVRRGTRRICGLCNDYLGYLADRCYASGTRRVDLLGFARWLAEQELRLAAVDTDAVLRFLSACRSGGLTPATTNRRLAAISGLFAFRSMRDPSVVNPMPKGAAVRRAAGRSGTACWATWRARRGGCRVDSTGSRCPHPLAGAIEPSWFRWRLSLPGEDASMASQRKYPQELRERATRMALEARRDPATAWGAIKRIADQLRRSSRGAADLGQAGRDR